MTELVLRINKSVGVVGKKQHGACGDPAWTPSVALRYVQRSDPNFITVRYKLTAYRSVHSMGNLLFLFMLF